VSGPTTADHLCVIDGSNMLHRAWAMGRPRARTADGLEVGASWLFSQMLVKLLRRMDAGHASPTHVAIFFDPPREDSWRREVSADYKAHRDAMDPALRAQIPIMIEACRAIGLASATAPRHEADDMIAAYAEDAAAAGARVSIISSDKDLMQLVRPGVMQMNAASDTWFNEAAVEKKFGVPPSLVGDFLALAGDSSDGVPGAPGIGPKSASALLCKFGSLGGLLGRAEQIERASWRRIICENKEQIRMSRMLVALDVDGAPRSLSWDEVRTPRPGFAGRAQQWREDALS